MNYKKEHFLRNTTAAIKLDQILKRRDTLELSERMSSRMVKCASVLPEDGVIGWQMEVPRKGLVNMTLFGSAGLLESDLKWITEKTAKTAAVRPRKGNETELTELYEVFLPVSESGRTSVPAIGFNAEASSSDAAPAKWPLCYTHFAEMVRVLQITGAIFRAVLYPAGAEAQNACRKTILRTWNPGGHGISAEDYIGRPVRARFLLRLPAAPSIRLRAVFEDAVSEAKLRRLGSMEDERTAAIWNDPEPGAKVLPDYAARILLMEPSLRDTVIGIETCEEPAKPIPAAHRNTKSPKAVVIGKAVNTAGQNQKITIGEVDLKRHYQIVGQTGTGKSTLLASIILSAIRQGHGLTFFDPHGTTIDVVLRALPEEYAEKVRVVRIGDVENPVPMNIWDSDDPQKEERTISDLCELFADIFDPKREGFVGPRYERWLSTFAKASIAFLGRRASLESIAVLSQSKDNMQLLCEAIGKDYPELAESIRQEYISDKSNEFQNTLNWYLCKFQRLTSVEHLRKTLGAGANALDFANTIDTDTVTLIDLASPVIGSNAARIIGTLQMMKLWNAARARKQRDRTHLVVVDEASLFQTNPMPRMLAEARKFGVSMVLCHQHTGQLTQEIRDALEANSANFSAFRLSPRDAAVAAIRFNDPAMEVSLTRLDAFNAITSISVDGRQTAPFTLKVDRSKEQREGDRIAADVERRSLETLVRPYEHLRALTPQEILYILKRVEEQEDTVCHDFFYGPYDASDYAVPDPNEVNNCDESEAETAEQDTRPEWLKTWAG